MKKLLLATALATLSTAAFAESTVATVRDVYVTQIVQVPREVEGCHMIDVPIYGNQSATAGEAVTGAIIGGAIGHQFGNGSGKDAMTIIGALIGANAADGNRKVITGYRKEQRCTKDIYYEDKQVRLYSHSVIEFEVDGKKRQVEFQK